MPQWDKTAGQVWDERFEALTRNNDLEKDIDADAHAKIFGLHRATRYVLSIAAAVLLLFTAVSLLYTKEETAGKGRTTSVNLPDGSLAQLSANSRLSYHPLLWFLSHKADLNGEAYFSGTHAKGFTVNTAQGNISVLGTSFNVSTFDNRFVVTCVTGKIAVKSRSESIELTSNMESTILDGRLTARHIANAESAIERFMPLVNGTPYAEDLTAILASVKDFDNAALQGQAAALQRRLPPVFAGWQ